MWSTSKACCNQNVSEIIAMPTISGDAWPVAFNSNKAAPIMSAIIVA